MKTKKIIASVVFFASLLGSLAFKPAIEKNKSLFEINRAFNDLLNVEKHVNKHSDLQEKVAGIYDGDFPIPNDEQEKIFNIDEEKLEHYLDIEPAENNYIDAFKEIGADLFVDKSRQERVALQKAIDDLSSENLESKIFSKTMFDITLTRENCEEKIAELKYDATPSILAPYSSIDFDFSIWLIDNGIDLEHKNDILECDFTAVPESIITTNPKMAAATMILVGGVYFSEAGLISFITAKLGTLFSVISGAIKSFAAVVNVPFIGWVLAAAIIVALTVIIILNWSKIVECFEHIKAWFSYVAKKFAAKIVALFENIVSQAANALVSDALDNVRANGSIGKWNLSKIKTQLGKCIFAGSNAIALVQLIRIIFSKYVYLGKLNDNDGYNYIQTAINEGGIYFYIPDSVVTYVSRYCNGDLWTLNATFLELCLLAGKLFKLCTRPSKYYSVTYNFYVESNPCSYAKELKFIHTNPFPRVTWYSDTPVVTTYHY